MSRSLSLARSAAGGAALAGAGGWGCCWNGGLVGAPPTGGRHVGRLAPPPPFPTPSSTPAHPLLGPKSDYNHRLLTHDRAMRAGLDDVGIGALFGLAPYEYEVGLGDGV